MLNVDIVVEIEPTFFTAV